MEVENKKYLKDTRWLKLVSRISAVLLLITVVILIISGWGITQTGIIYKLSFGLIDRRTADVIHRAIDIPLGVFFLTHVFANIRLLIRTNKPALIWLTDVLLVLAGLGFLAIFIIMGRV